jgi:hypothetical protein
MRAVKVIAGHGVITYVVITTFTPGSSMPS